MIFLIKYFPCRIGFIFTNSNTQKGFTTLSSHSDEIVCEEISTFRNIKETVRLAWTEIFTVEMQIYNTLHRLLQSIPGHVHHSLVLASFDFSLHYLRFNYWPQGWLEIEGWKPGKNTTPHESRKQWERWEGRKEAEGIVKPTLPLLEEATKINST